MRLQDRFPDRGSHPFPIRLAISLLILAAALAAALLLRPVLMGQSLFLMLGAVVICSLYAGLPITLLIATLACVGHNYFFQVPAYNLNIASERDLIELFVFFSVALIVSWLGTSLHRAQAEAEMASRSRQDLLAVVSHDLKNPLVSIRMNLQLIGKLLNRHGSFPDVEGRLRSIEQSVAQMSRLIQDLLDQEKIRAGRFELETRSCAVDDLLREAYQSMYPIAEAKGIALAARSGSPDLWVRCDPERVLQALSNLLGNAVKFTAPGGSVSVTAEAAGPEVRFVVRDNGPGIPAEQLPHLFDRFWQARGTSRLGTGLGLSIARGIVEAHGGRIWVDSKVGEGSSFFFALPRSLPQERPLKSSMSDAM